MNLETLADACVRAYPGSIIAQIKCLRKVVQDLTGEWRSPTLREAKDAIEAAQLRRAQQNEHELWFGTPENPIL